MICGSATETAMAKVEAPSVCALTSCSCGNSKRACRKISDQERRDADGDQRHLRRVPHAQRDEEDRQDRERRDHPTGSPRTPETCLRITGDKGRWPTRRPARSAPRCPTPAPSSVRLDTVSPQNRNVTRPAVRLADKPHRRFEPASPATAGPGPAGFPQAAPPIRRNRRGKTSTKGAAASVAWPAARHAV